MFFVILFLKLLQLHEASQLDDMPSRFIDFEKNARDVVCLTDVTAYFVLPPWGAFSESFVYLLFIFVNIC